MTEHHNPTSVSVSTSSDSFAIAAGKVDTSYYILKGEQTITTKVESCERSFAKGKSHEDVEKGLIQPEDVREMIVVKARTEKDYNSNARGKTIGKGYACYVRIGITPYEAHVNDQGQDVKARTNEDIGKDIARLMQAAFGPKTDRTVRELLDSPSILVGQLIDFKVSITPARGQFPESNAFRPVVNV